MTYPLPGPNSIFYRLYFYPTITTGTTTNANWITDQYGMPLPPHVEAEMRRLAEALLHATYLLPPMPVPYLNLEEPAAGAPEQRQQADPKGEKPVEWTEEELRRLRFIKKLHDDGTITDHPSEDE